MHGKIRFEGLSQRASRTCGRGSLVNLGLAALVLAVAPGTLAAREAPSPAPVPEECQKPDLSAAEQARCDFIARTPDLCLRSGLSEETQRFCDELGEPPACAWPFAWTPFGLGNWLFPDTGNRWPYMAIDPQWQEVTITGAYPKARFFSFAVYNNAPVSTGLADRLFDQEIVPDPGSVNPFGPSASSTDEPQTYTITVTRTDSTDNNVLRFDAETGWLVYRLYLPDAGEGSMGGVPLPSVSITDARGQVTPLPICPFVNRQSEIAALQPQILPALLESPPATPPVPDHIWFGPVPAPPVRLLPNPDNAYMVSFFMSDYQPGRIIVIRGKMPAFPDTFRGAPVSQPAPGFDTIQLRYWSMCLGELVSPLPIVGCAVDAATPLDRNDFYTIVISNDVLRPDWLPRRPRVVWLPWGDEQIVPRTMLIRNLLPSLGFTQSVQDAIAQGCGVDFEFPTPPTQDEITDAGQCAQNVMGEYYPVAAWCDEELFIDGGWQACFAAAGIP
jgi:hypothetical protein